MLLNRINVTKHLLSTKGEENNEDEMDCQREIKPFPAKYFKFTINVPHQSFVMAWEGSKDQGDIK